MRTFAFACSLMFVAMLMAGAAELPIQGTFQMKGGDTLPENWAQGKGGDLEPLGKAEVVDEVFERPIKAVKLTSATKPTLIHTINSYPVRPGDCVAVRMTFKGKGTASVGYYGYDAAMRQTVAETHSFNAYNDAWDSRSKVFEVKDAKTAFIRIFFSAPANTVMTFAELTARKLDSGEAVLFSPAANRELWRKRTQGVNLAAGAKLSFEPKPDYELTTKGGSDATDLTDGVLGSASDLLWFDSEAVAWYRALNGVTAIVDLGAERPVGKAVIRVNGGQLNGINFPRRLEAWVSKDGKNYYQAAGLTKVAFTERSLSDWKNLYYLPESEDGSGVHYVYPFELAIDADARYVALRAPVYTALMMVSDELAVIQADDAGRRAPGYNAAYRKQPQPIFHKTVVIRPRLDTFYVPDNVQVPNWLQIEDHRDNKNGKLGYIIDTPAEIEFTEDKSYPAFTRALVKTENAGGRKRHHFEVPVDNELFSKALEGFGPFFFKANGKAIPDKEKYVMFTSTVDGVAQYTHRSPLEIISVPEVPPLKRLSVCLSWMRGDQSAAWPGFLEAQRHLGFNTIPFFPLLRKVEQFKPLLDEAVRQGFKIRLQMSPTGMMNALNRDSDEYKCVGFKTKRNSACPAYRGTYYQKMLEGIAEAVAKFPADYVTFDEETWEPTQLEECIHCPRCDALRKSKGMGWKEYLDWAQADYLKGFKDAVAKGSGENKTPVVGYYALIPDNTYSCSAGKIPFLGYKHLYPKWCDELQPSYYGDAPRVAHDELRKVFRQVPRPEGIIPWLTAGSGAHRSNAMGRAGGQQALEALMNGAGGLQYFAYFSFESPIDYYYLAAVLKQLAPYEDLLMRAQLIEVTASNPDLVYTARLHGEDMLLLVGNYGKMTPARTAVNLPAGNIADVLALGDNKKFRLDGCALTVDLNPDDYSLFYIRYNQ